MGVVLVDIPELRWEMLAESGEAVNVGLLSDEELVAFNVWCQEQLLRTKGMRSRYGLASVIAEGEAFRRFAALVNARKEGGQ